MFKKQFEPAQSSGSRSILYIFCHSLGSFLTDGNAGTGNTQQSGFSASLFSEMECGNGNYVRLKNWRPVARGNYNRKPSNSQDLVLKAIYTAIYVGKFSCSTSAPLSAALLPQLHTFPPFANRKPSRRANSRSEMSLLTTSAFNVTSSANMLKCFPRSLNAVRLSARFNLATCSTAP